MPPTERVFHFEPSQFQFSFILSYKNCGFEDPPPPPPNLEHEASI